MREPRLLGLCGILGPLFLTIYFIAPALLDWPFAGAPVDQLATYATQHEILFYAGAWLQVTGTLLSVVFFLGLILRARARDRLAGLVTIVTSTTLLAIVLVEAALMMAVPAAAKAGDTPTLATAFALSNGGFMRVFAIAPASVTYIALGFALLGSPLVHRWFGYTAVAFGAAFELAGIVALFSPAGLVLVIALSVTQAIWIVAAATLMVRRG